MSTHKQPVPSVASVSVSESLAATVQTLVRLNEEEFFSSLTPDSYQQLTAVQAALSTVVGEDENHLFAPLATFISNLIKNQEDERKIRASDKTRPVRGRAETATEAEPEYTADMLISVNPHYEEPGETWNSTARPVRGHAEKTTEAEPEYAADMLISVNPHYEEPSDTWNGTARNEAEFLTSLTPEDRGQLAAALAALQSVVGEEENHILAPLMDFIANLVERELVGIEKSEAKIGVKCQNDSSATGTPDSHRPERMGRPAMLPRLKMADLLAQETMPHKVEEIDTGTPVGKEVW